MNWSTSLLLVVVVASNVIAASALDCYSCETHRNGACGEQFNSDKVATCNNGGICARKTDKDNGKYDTMVHAVKRPNQTQERSINPYE